MIVCDKENGLFTLHTRRTTYQMKVSEQGVLLHTYYGPRVRDWDLSHLIRRADRGFTPAMPGRGGPSPWTPCRRSIPPVAWGISV